MKRLDATAQDQCKIGLEVETPTASGFDPASKQAALVLEEIRQYLRDGCTIKATDPNGRILELLPDGTCYSGLTITSSTYEP